MNKNDYLVKFFLYTGPMELISSCYGNCNKRIKRKRHGGCQYGCIGRVKNICPFYGDGTIVKELISYFKVMIIPKYRAEFLDKLVTSRN